MQIAISFVAQRFHDFVTTKKTTSPTRTPMIFQIFACNDIQVTSVVVVESFQFHVKGRLWGLPHDMWIVTRYDGMCSSLPGMIEDMC